MTNTTIADQEKRRLRIIAWSAAMGLHVVLAIAVLTITPLRQSVIGMSTEEIEDVARIDREAAARNKAREAQRREQALPESFREDLKQEIARQREGELQQNVRDLREIREKIEEQQQKAFDALREFAVERSPEDIEQHLERIEHNITRARIGEDLDEQRKNIRSNMNQARKEAEALEEDVRDQPQRVKTAEASQAVADAAAKFADDLRQDARRKYEARNELREQIAKADPESQEAKEKTEQAERLGRYAQINNQLADNIENHAKSLKASAEHLHQTPNVAADTAVPQEAVNPPEAGTPADDQALEKQSADELYETARKLEEEIDRRYRDTRAAQQAVRDRSSFEAASEVLNAQPKPDRPDLAKSIAETGLETLGEVSDLRQTLRNAVTQTQLMRADAQRQLVEVDPDAARHLGRNLAKATPPVVHGPAMTGANSSPGESPGGFPAEFADDEQTIDISDTSLTKEQAAATALPGRRFTDGAARRGWMYVDTWYVIGPWDLRQHARQTLPPEVEINLDAVYTNGKITERAWHPRLRKYFPLNGRLTWQFIQSESIYVRPPNETDRAIYFAYTELFSDRERDVLFAIDIDDYSELWVNDEKVWSGTVNSWQFGQTTRHVTLKPGYNRILIRMENDPPEMDFSLVLLASD